MEKADKLKELKLLALKVEEEKKKVRREYMRKYRLKQKTF